MVQCNLSIVITLYKRHVNVGDAFCTYGWNYSHILTVKPVYNGHLNIVKLTPFLCPKSTFFIEKYLWIAETFFFLIINIIFYHVLSYHLFVVLLSRFYEMSCSHWHKPYYYMSLHHTFQTSAQKQPPEVFCKKGFLKNFANFIEKHLLFYLRPRPR